MKVETLPKRRRKKPCQAVQMADSIVWPDYTHAMFIGILNGSHEFDFRTTGMDLDVALDMLCEMEAHLLRNGRGVK